MEYRFIADAMLGKLAKWLRIMGCDVEYFSSISDKELVERAYSSGRIILTRDTLLIRRRKAKNNHLFIHSDSYKEQVKQVVKHFSIDPFTGLLTRCLICNILLKDIERELVKTKMPQYVYETQDSFKICPSCSRLYWQATHRDKMVRQLMEILA
ncbi:MAG: Mut7-C RNAse domain-containing protein [Deltaproteobacteria bacterium]|nr:Mut7-C RNAse domain-containing protein [Deltaproteobacteria bacterium]